MSSLKEKPLARPNPPGSTAGGGDVCKAEALKPTLKICMCTVVLVCLATREPVLLWSLKKPQSWWVDCVHRCVEQSFMTAVSILKKQGLCCAFNNLQ